MLQRESLPFSVETLKRLLSEHKLRMLPSKLPEGAKGNALVPPPTPPLQLLADSIEQLRQELIAADPVQIPGLHDGTMARAADTLAEGLPRIPPLDPQQNAELEALRMALFVAREHLVPPPLPMPAARIDILDRLAQAYRFAHAYAWPDAKPLGISNEGPLVRFITAAVPHLTPGPFPTCGAVAQHLKRLRDKRRREECGARLPP